MEKYEAFDAILDHILATRQGHSNHIKYNVAFFKDMDQSRIDLMLEDMYRTAPKAFDRKEYHGRPALVSNNYTHLLKEDGGFERILQEKKTELVRQKVIFQKADGKNLLSDLHLKVQEVASALFEDGYFAESILKTYIALSVAVKEKSGLSIDNTGLMNSAFSANNPVLKISDDPDEQKGFMWLYSGAMMGIRNPKAHRLIEQHDPQRTLEWLSFASVLFKVLDDSQKVP